MLYFRSASRFLAILALSCSAAQAAETITGRANVIDGDTIEIHGHRIRLFGIDAPESAQRCTNGSGEAWRCGQAAALALADQLDGATVACTVRDIDRYRRFVVVCFARGMDVNEWLVNEGWAVAYLEYSRAYAPAQARARGAKRGVWAGPFELPKDYRRARR